MLSYIKILGFFLMHVSLIKYILTNNTFTFALCKMKLFKNKKLIKFYVKSTMSQERLSELVILPIENEILTKLEKKKKNNNNNVVSSNLASQKSRK